MGAMRGGRWIAICSVSFACQTVAPATRPGDAEGIEVIPSVLSTPVEFSGWAGETRQPSELSEIRIGVFAPTDTAHPIGGPLHRAVALAIEQINLAGGFEGVPLRLVSRWSDDPWRGGSREMIKLVYADSVWAVIGSVDGSSTHVAEQVTTKAWVPLLAPVSTDPTLTYVRIPWIFRLPPSEERQAAALLHDGIRARSLERVGLVSSTDHDGRIFAGEMLASLRAARLPPPFHFQLSDSDIDLAEVARRMALFRPDGLIVRLPTAETIALLERLHEVAFSAPVFIPWIPGLSESELAGRYGADILQVLPFCRVGHEAYDEFARSYAERYHAPPTPEAAYAYDAVNLVFAAMTESGLNRSRLRKAIYERSKFPGVTGEIEWDNAGGNVAEAVVRAVQPASMQRGR